MGGVSRIGPGGVGRSVGGVGQGRSASEVSKTPSGPEEAETPEAEWSQDQTCLYCKDLRSTKNVNMITPSEGWAPGTQRNSSWSHTAGMPATLRLRSQPVMWTLSMTPL